ncbi:hypothetical protein Rrhod_0323 [Rhodococcus rhodnii LMG 5362]|uniref:Uncharacterized protein n=1 Tax=Rhodococcus rhodnii LMG 5362 TaxID=1273125 RepID=R7WSU6_9NOCA|nr:hypothetical protein Rrhod_0323 [Rhodococcus rhodnii LMG 5362]
MDHRPSSLVNLVFRGPPGLWTTLWNLWTTPAIGQFRQSAALRAVVGFA